MLLGEIVTWDITAKEVSCSDITAALISAGISTDTLSDMQPRSAFSRACQLLKENRAIDKVEVKGKETIFQFTSKMIDNGRAEYDYECRVVLDTETGKVSCPEDSQLETEATGLVSKAMVMRNAQDITRMVQGLFQKHADLYPINPRKGVAYFVPDKHKDFTAKIEQFLKQIGGSLLRFPVPKGTPEGDASVRDAVSGGLESMMQELDQVVGGWDESTRKGTMDRTMEKYGQIEYKISAYAEYLSGQQQALLVKLEERKKLLAEKIEKSFAAELTE